MKGEYPTQAYLAAVLKTLVHAQRSDAERVPMDMTRLKSWGRQQCVNDLPLYCDRAVLKTQNVPADSTAILARFRLGKTQNELAVMEATVNLLLTPDSFGEQLPEKAVTNLLSRFFWDFKGRLDHEVWQLLERRFDIEFIVMKDDVIELKKFLRRTIERLKNLGGPIPLYSMGKTHRFIRSMLHEYSSHHSGAVVLRRDVLEDLLRQSDDLLHNEYIPFFECLFQAWDEMHLCLLDVDVEKCSFDPDNREVHYDYSYGGAYTGSGYIRTRLRMCMNEKHGVMLT